MPVTKKELETLQRAADEAGDRVRDLLERIQRALGDKPEETPPTQPVLTGRGTYTNGKYTGKH